MEVRYLRAPLRKYTEFMNFYLDYARPLWHNG
jgi:hypothetical protein